MGPGHSRQAYRAPGSGCPWSAPQPPCLPTPLPALHPLHPPPHSPAGLRAVLRRRGACGLGEGGTHQEPQGLLRDQVKLTQLTQLGLILHEVDPDLALEGIGTAAGLSALCLRSCCLIEAITIARHHTGTQCCAAVYETACSASADSLPCQNSGSCIGACSAWSIAQSTQDVAGVAA